ncbi:MAG TPA: peptidase S41 [Porticoccaceae bacterium]|nr:peptidase S41 [Porticoccaceae bacterium]
MSRIARLICWTTFMLAPAALGEEPATTTEADSSARLPLEELQLFAQVFEQIRNTYVEEIDDRELLENAIVGLLAELDPHSAFLKAESFEEIQEQTSGEFGGIGIEVGMEDGFVKVISPIDDTPAAKAGILPGDFIVKLNDQAVRGMTLEEAINIMRGEKGSSLSLTISRKNTDQPLQFTLIRDTISIKSVRHKVLEPGYGYIRIAQFQSRTGEEFKNSVTALTKETTALHGLVLDLRNNPGGLLSASVEVADALLDEGLIVYTEGRTRSSRHRYSANKGVILEDIPLVVLINGGSASASEIVAGAIQDHKRGVIMGTDSFGKGSVQTVLPLDDGRAIKLTTARYFTPNGRSIQAVSIQPDIYVERAEIRALTKNFQMREANLNKHLGGEEAVSGKTRTENQDVITADNQLYEALNLLKGLNILSKSTKVLMD